MYIFIYIFVYSYGYCTAGKLETYHPPHTYKISTSSRFFLSGEKRKRFFVSIQIFNVYIVVFGYWILSLLGIRYSVLDTHHCIISPVFGGLSQRCFGFKWMKKKISSVKELFIIFSFVQMTFSKTTFWIHNNEVNRSMLAKILVKLFV